MFEVIKSASSQSVLGEHHIKKLKLFYLILNKNILYNFKNMNISMLFLKYRYVPHSPIYISHNKISNIIFQYTCISICNVCLLFFFFLRISFQSHCRQNKNKTKLFFFTHKLLFAINWPQLIIKRGKLFFNYMSHHLRHHTFGQLSAKSDEKYLR